MSAPYRQLFALCAFGVFATTQPAAAFTEDQCFLIVDDDSDTPRLLAQPFNCFDWNCTDLPDDVRNQVIDCSAETIDAWNRSSTSFSEIYLNMIGLARGQDLPALHSTSNLHFTIPWIAGRIGGLPPDDALRLATYALASDKGVYEHFDVTGTHVVAESIDLSGIARTNTGSIADAVAGGAAFHFPVKYGSAGPLVFDDAYSNAGSPIDDDEIVLAHLRAWAFGERDSLCAYGMAFRREGRRLHVDPRNGACIDDDDAPMLAVSFPSFSISPEMDVTDENAQNTLAPDMMNFARLTDQIIIEKRSATGTLNVEVSRVLSRAFASIYAGSEVALGIYLHTLADRLSHHYCTNDAAVVPATTTAGWETHLADYIVEFPRQCEAQEHAFRHFGESGGHLHAFDSEQVHQAQTRAGIRLTVLEIDRWLSARGNEGLHDIDLDALTSDLESAVASPCALGREAELCDVAYRHGIRGRFHNGLVIADDGCAEHPEADALAGACERTTSYPQGQSLEPLTEVEQPFWWLDDWQSVSD